MFLACDCDRDLLWRLTCGPWWTWLCPGDCITDHRLRCARVPKADYWHVYALTVRLWDAV